MDKTEIIRKILGEDPKNASAWYLLGVEYLEQGMPSEALQAFSEALKHCDDELRQKVFTELAKLSGTPTSANSAVERHAHNTDNAGNGNSSDDAGRSGQAGNLVNLRVIQGGKKGQKTDLADKTLTTITFDDVGGLEDLKETIRMRIVRPFTTPGLFERFKKKIGGGILLFGPPGCGKTLLAAATASEIDAAFYNVDAATVMSKWLGESERNVANLFEASRRLSESGRAAIIFMDEVDSLVGVRSEEVGGEVRMRNQFMKEMDSVVDKNKRLHVYVIGATNKPWNLDVAFLRRFQKRIYVSLPNVDVRRGIFELYTKKLMQLGRDVSLDELAKITGGYSGSDLYDIVQAVQLKVVREFFLHGNPDDPQAKLRPITMKDFNEVLTERKPSVSRETLASYENWFEKFKAL